MKKKLSLLLAAAMTAGLVLTGCGGSGSGGAAGSTEQTTAAGAAGQETTA